MARDPSLAVRMAIVAALEDSAAVTALVPIERIFAVAPTALPVRPFIHQGLASATPFRASGLDGSRVTLSVHGIAAGPQEDAVSALGAAIAAALDGRVLALDGAPPALAHLRWRGSRLRRDGDAADAFEAVVVVEAVVIG